MRGVLLVLASGCATDFTLSEQLDAAEPSDDTAFAVVLDEDRDTGAADTGAPPADTGATTTESGCVDGTWSRATFTFPPDDLSCAGDQVIRFDADQGLWVGLVSCGGTELRVYLSAAESGPYLPALDVAGHGQDHCQLVDPTFTIPNEDDITSGGCATCATSTNLPLEGVPGWYRAFYGEPFTYVERTGEWSWQTSRLDCGVPAAQCDD